MPREVVVSEDARPVRSKVGPVAWVILEELVGCGEDRPRSVHVATTVRRLAEAVGLSKDTVASGLRRLMREGLVTREDQRDRSSGCFGRSLYKVDLSRTGLRTSSTAGPTPVTESRDVARSRRVRETSPVDDRSLDPPRDAPPLAHGQMSLLDAVPPTPSQTKTPR